MRLPPAWNTELARLHSDVPAVPFDDLLPQVEQALGRSGTSAPVAATSLETAVPAVVEMEDAQRTARAISIWNEAGDPRGTPVEAHLRSRGLFLPESAAGRAIRYHPSCPFAGGRTPAMICLIRDVQTDEPKAIHRTALTLGGQKAKIGGSDRLALGPMRGGAIKLTPHEDVTVCLGIGEGIETSLSLQCLPEFGPSPIWALISAPGLASFPRLSGIESLWIAVDNDESGTGQKAARACAHRWRASGAETFLVTPTSARTDLNDILPGRA